MPARGPALAPGDMLQAASQPLRQMQMPTVMAVGAVGVLQANPTDASALAR